MGAWEKDRTSLSPRIKHSLSKNSIHLVLLLHLQLLRKGSISLLTACLLSFCSLCAVAWVYLLNTVLVRTTTKKTFKTLVEFQDAGDDFHIVKWHIIKIFFRSFKHLYVSSRTQFKHTWHWTRWKPCHTGPEGAPLTLDCVCTSFRVWSTRERVMFVFSSNELRDDLVSRHREASNTDRDRKKSVLLELCVIRKL